MSIEISERQKQLLQLIICHHLNSAEPIGSKLLIDSGDLDVSGATIRNDMRALEEAGYLTHPHTSAGRVPTQEGYRFYTDNFMTPEELGQDILRKLEQVFSEISEKKQAIKQIAKLIAEYAGNAVIIGFGNEGIYYTGLSHLFANPEFRDHGLSINMSEIFDRCEQLLPELNDRMEKNIQVFIGSSNPLGSLCGTVASKLKNNIIFAAVGPIRMNYPRNVALAQYIKDSF